jgi:hypothetical protein
MTPIITLTEAISDTTLLGGPFTATSFWTWRVVAKLIDGIPLTEPREIELFEQCTARTYDREAVRAVRRLIVLVGRRGGKDRFMSAVAVWRAALCQNWNTHISAGEGAVVLLLGADRKQAAILRRYCHGLLQKPGMAAEVSRITDEVVEFKSGGSLEIITNDVRLVRGRSAIGVLGSESCQWRTDETNASSDEEVVAAATPSMAMCPDGPGLLLLGSSVFRRRGYMYRQFKTLHGNSDADADAICWFAPSQTMNPKLPQSVIDAALAEDRLKFSAEYLNIWREDVSDFVPLDIVEHATDFDVYERPPQPGSHQYFAFHDAATGVPGGASFTMAITHREGDDAVLDLVRERKPRFVMRDVVAEFSQTLQAYNISEISGDKFARLLVADEFARNGIRSIDSEFDTSGNYQRLMPMLMSGRAKLVNSATLRSQLCSLERHVPPSGHEQIRKPQVASAHDDVAAAVAGALVRAGGKRTMFGPDAIWLDHDSDADQQHQTGSQTYAQQQINKKMAEAAAKAEAAQREADALWRRDRYLREHVLGIGSGGDRRQMLFQHPGFRSTLYGRR